MNIIVRISDKLAARLGLFGPDLERQALEALMLENYRAGRMTTDDLHEALGFDAFSQVEDFLKAHGVLEPSAVKEVDARAKGAEDGTVTVSAKEYARLKRRDRQVHRVEDLPEDIIDRIARAEMDPRHDHLNELLADWAP